VKTKRCINRAFTLIEVLLVIAGISAIGAVGYVATSNLKATAEAVKLESDVKSINQAIDLYRANGGQISADVDDVLNNLKTRADSATAGTMIGLKASFLDVRTEWDTQSASEAATSQLRAVWDPVAMAFSTSTGSTLGIKRFRIKNELASAAPVTDPNPRMPTFQGAASGWVWDHAVAKAVTATSGISPSLAALLSHQHLTGGAFIVGETGQVVTENKIYDGAGYEGELGIFSLEGMGSDIYDLTTAAGILGFMREAVRRVATGDRGGIAMDRQGRGSTLNFATGTAVAFVLIPNDSFTNSNSFLAGANPSISSTSYPLTSLSFNTGDVSGFSNSQAISLGNDVYAFEDLPGGGDRDFEDIVFKTTGVTQPDWSTIQRVDASTYYTEAKLNQLGDPILGAPRQTLRQALTGVNVLP